MIPIHVENERPISVVGVEVAAVLVCLYEEAWVAADVNGRTGRRAELPSEWAADER